VVFIYTRTLSLCAIPKVHLESNSDIVLVYGFVKAKPTTEGESLDSEFHGTHECWEDPI
jgi:hypothetical protein